MNEFKVQQILNRWSDLIVSTHKSAIDNTTDRDRVIVKDNKLLQNSYTTKEQKKIVDELCEELPQLENLIRSEPYLENLEWKTLDCIEIVFNHYNIVIQKIKDYLCDL